MTGRHRTSHALRSLGSVRARTALVAVAFTLVALGGGLPDGRSTATPPGEETFSLVMGKPQHHTRRDGHARHRSTHQRVRHDTKRPVRHVSAKPPTKPPTKPAPKPAPKPTAKPTPKPTPAPAPAPPAVRAPTPVLTPTPVKATLSTEPVRHDVTSIVTETSTEVTSVRASSEALAAAGAGPAPLPTPIGFGAATTGGAGGAVYHVTSSADSLVDPAPGTLRYGLTGEGPTWIVFDQDLEITLAGGLRIPSDTTIDGRGHQVLVTGHGVGGLLIWDATNVIVENVELRDFGDTMLTSSNDVPDAIDIQRSSRVWIDHCTLSHAGDKLIQVVGGSKDVTVSWNRFYDQEQVMQIGTMASALLDTATTVTVHHNFFDHVGYRLPLVAYAKVHVYDNYMLGWTVSGVRSERLAQVYLENNVLSAESKPKAALVKAASVCNDAGTYCDPREGYLTAIGNLLWGKAKIMAPVQGHVFSPSEAYAYTAEPATEALAAVVAADAGAH